jgi:hypothetical protein
MRWRFSSAFRRVTQVAAQLLHSKFCLLTFRKVAITDGPEGCERCLARDAYASSTQVCLEDTSRLLAAARVGWCTTAYVSRLIATPALSTPVCFLDSLCFQVYSDRVGRI